MDADIDPITLDTEQHNSVSSSSLLSGSNRKSPNKRWPDGNFGRLLVASCFEGYPHMARGGFKVENGFDDTHWTSWSAAAP